MKLLETVLSRAIIAGLVLQLLHAANHFYNIFASYGAHSSSLVNEVFSLSSRVGTALASKMISVHLKQWRMHWHARTFGSTRILLKYYSRRTKKFTASSFDVSPKSIHTSQSSHYYWREPESWPPEVQCLSFNHSQLSVKVPRVKPFPRLCCRTAAKTIVIVVEKILQTGFFRYTKRRPSLPVSITCYPVIFMFLNYATLSYCSIVIDKKRV